MIRSLGASIFLAASLSMPSRAQAPDAVFVRAQAMVSDGNATAGRALVDSIVNATALTSPLYVEALFWKASLASSASEAERSYRQIVVDFPLAPRAEESLLRLAQLQLARGDKEGALTHLRRLRTDYPGGKGQARAGYWTARVLFEKNDVATACAANAAALALVAPAEVELRNQIQYLSQRCPAQAASIPVSSPPAVDSPLRPSPTPADTKPANVPVVTAATPSPRTEVPTSPPPKVEKPAASPPARTERPPSSAASGGWSVQVAAYNTRAEAEKFAANLETRGYDARVDGTVKPFRVKIGRYSTAAEANTELTKIKAKRMAGFVTRAE